MQIWLPTSLLDRKKSLRKFLKALQPEALFLIKYEFWPNLLIEVEKTEYSYFLYRQYLQKGAVILQIVWFFICETYCKK